MLHKVTVMTGCCFSTTLSALIILTKNVRFGKNRATWKRDRSTRFMLQRHNHGFSASQKIKKTNASYFNIREMFPRD